MSLGPLRGPKDYVSLPVSRILFSNLFDEVEEVTIHLGPALPRGLGAAYLGFDPRRSENRAGYPSSLLGLAPGGVCLAIPVSRDAGGLLHHRFTLAGW